MESSCEVHRCCTWHCCRRLDGSIQARRTRARSVTADVAQGTLQFSGDALFDGDASRRRLRVQGHGGSLKATGALRWRAQAVPTGRRAPIRPSRWQVSVARRDVVGRGTPRQRLSPTWMSPWPAVGLRAHASGKLRGRFTQAPTPTSSWREPPAAAGALWRERRQARDQDRCKRPAELARCCPSICLECGRARATATLEDPGTSLPRRTRNRIDRAWRFAVIGARGQRTANPSSRCGRCIARRRARGRPPARSRRWDARRARATPLAAPIARLAFSIHDDELGVEDARQYAAARCPDGAAASIAHRAAFPESTQTPSAPADLELGSDYVVLGAARPQPPAGWTSTERAGVTAFEAAAGSGPRWRRSSSTRV
jgi:hypothetical protein